MPPSPVRASLLSERASGGEREESSCPREVSEKEACSVILEPAWRMNRARVLDCWTSEESSDASCLPSAGFVIAAASAFSRVSSRSEPELDADPADPGASYAAQKTC